MMSNSIGQDEIQIKSTSLSTADTTPIILNSTNFLRLYFAPTLVNNPKSPEKCISGKLVYEKKKKSDSEFPTDKISRGSIKTGEYMEISLKTAEIHALFEGLQKHYLLYKEMGHIPIGETTYTRIDQGIKNMLEIIKSDPALMENVTDQNVLDLVQQLLKVIIASNSTEGLSEILSAFETEGIEKLSDIVSIEKLNRIQQLVADNIGNPDEEFWQMTFKENSWILTQIFASPMTIIEDKAYVGGKSIDNKGGHICDFLYANEISKNVALIEIKTPCTNIIGNEYRNGIYSMSNDFSGAINQVIAYKDSLIKEYSLLCRGTDYKALNPNCVIIIGNTRNISRTELSSFELFRNTFGGITIITYDELLGRIKKFIDIVVDNQETLEEEGLSEDIDDDCPF